MHAGRQLLRCNRSHMNSKGITISGPREELCDVPFVYLEKNREISTTVGREYRHPDKMFVTGCKGSCPYSNIRCNEWRLFRHYDDISVSVNAMCLNQYFASNKYYQGIATHGQDSTGCRSRTLLDSLFNGYNAIFLLHNMIHYNTRSTQKKPGLTAKYMARHKKARFDTKMPGSTQKCPPQHAPVDIVIIKHPPPLLWEIFFPNFIPIFCF